MDERLTVTSTQIRYIFRTGYQSEPTARAVVCIPFDKICSVEYDDKLSKITFKGSISSDVFENYHPTSCPDPDSGNLQEFSIYDYFEPRLLDAVKTSGVLRVQTITTVNSEAEEQ